MNILFITHHYLSSNGGGSFASRAYINAFANVASQMTLLYPVKTGENVFPEINQKISLVPVEYNIPKWKKLIHLLAGKVHRFSPVAGSFIKSNNFDIVIFDTSLVSYRLIKKAQKNGLKTIVIHHNYQYEYFRDNSHGIISIPTLFWCKRYEKQAICNADLNLTLTKQDISLLSKNYCNSKTDHFSLLGTFEYTSARPLNVLSIPNKLIRFVITGNLEANQTKQSIHDWIVTYYPILKEIFPEATLTIAGRNPSKDLQKQCLDNEITLIASPSSMSPIMEKADCYICPTDLGGGIKLRIMDGLKYGLPVVTHSISARGYDLFQEAGVLFSYNNTQEFRQSLLDLKQRTFDKQTIIDSYKNIFSFEAGVKRVINAMQTLNISTLE